MGLTKWEKEKLKRQLPTNYHPSKLEEDAYQYCLRNDIRISPVGIVDKIGQWKIGISTPDDYKKVYKSPETCDKHSVWQVFYKYCIYYYEKSI